MEFGLKNGRICVGLVLAAACGVARGAEVDYATLYATMVKDSEAQQKMIDGGMEAATYLVGRLTEAPDAKKVAGLIKQLDDENFKVRNAAQVELTNLGKPAEKLVEAALEGDVSAEVKERLQGILEKVKGNRGLDPTEAARQQLAVKIVAQQGTKALPLLRELKEKAVWDSTRREASKALVVGEKKGLAVELEAVTAGGKVDEARFATVMERIRGAALENDVMVKFQLSRIEATKAAEGERAKLEAKLKGNPADKETRTALVKLLVVDLGDTAEAAKVAQGGEVDRNWKEMAPLFAKDVKSLSQGELVKVGEEARKLSLNAGAAGRIRMLRVCVDANARLTGGEFALDEAQVVAIKKVLEACSAEMGAILTGMELTGWKNGLEVADVRNDVIGGEWVKEKGGMVLKVGEFGLLNVPVEMPESYVLRVKLTRREGTDGVYVGFPVGKSRANLNLGGWGNTISGMETIDNVGADGQQSDELRRESGLENGKAYTYVIEVKVKGAEASVVIVENDKRFVKWSGDPATLTSHGAWKPEKQTGVGLGAHQSAVFFEEVLVKRMEGGKK